MTAVDVSRSTGGATPASIAGKRVILDRSSRLLWLSFMAIGAAWALAFAHDTGYPVLRVWGSLAVVAYSFAALAAVALPRRWVPSAVASTSVVGAVLAPLAVLAVNGQAQSEVGVVERSAQLLVQGGPLYLSNPQQRFDYNPYLPGMSVFGLPHQLLDRHSPTGTAGAVLTILGDARIWFALVFVACLVASWLLLRRASSAGERAPADSRLLIALIGGPMVAVPLCVSGVDLPMIGLSCLAVACAARGWGFTTGLVTALTCALKWTAWPLLPVVTVLVFMRSGLRAALWSALLGVAATAGSIVPFALDDGRAMITQVAKFPLGLAQEHTSAASPLPGHLLADMGSLGRAAGLALLVISCGTVAVWTIRRPPRTAVQAVNRLAAGLTAAFLFAPSSRFGYFGLPLVLWLLPHLASGSVQLTVPHWRRGHSLHVVLTFAPTKPATTVV